jgi:hypothetical protein
MIYDDILGPIEKEKKVENLFTKEMYSSWCAVFCIIQLNYMVDIGIMEISDGGEKPIVVTEKGEINTMKYFKEFLKREPNDEDIEIGMEVLRNEGYI